MKKIFIILTFFFLFVVLLVIFLLLLKGRDNYPEPEIILLNMFNKYSKVANYQDSGKIQKLSIVNGNEVRKESYFKCAYAKAVGFRFEHDEKTVLMKQKSVFWREGDKSYHYMDILNQYKRIDSIADAVFDSTLHRTLFVPLLLHGNVDKFKDLKYLAVTGSEKISDSLCYVLRGTWFDTITYWFWIDENSYLLKKIKYEMKTNNNKKKSNTDGVKSEIPQTSVKIVVKINIIKVNQPIGLQRMTFNPPEGANLVTEWNYDKLEDKIRKEIQKKTKS